jgi:uncharacterized protein (TIGR02594 family)
MRKSKIFLGLICLLATLFNNTVQGAVIPETECICKCTCETEAPVSDIRSSAVQLAESQIGIAEATGKNDGADVLKYQKSTGNTTGDQWCASFVAWVLKNSGVIQTGNAYSPTWFTATTTIYKPSTNLNHTPRAGDVFGVWVQSKGRVGHVGLIAEWGDKEVLCIEGNYSDKVVKQRRLTRQIYVASDWIENQSTI